MATITQVRRLEKDLQASTLPGIMTRRYWRPDVLSSTGSMLISVYVPGREAPTGERKGALALIGAWSELGDEQIDALLAEIYADRDRDTGRAVNLR